MIMTDGSVIALVTWPLTATILGLAIAFFILPFALRLYARARGRRDLAALAETDVG